jgi:hypothetical protein
MPIALNPWLGVSLIAIGVTADVILSLTHNTVPSVVTSVIVAGIGVLQAVGHARAARAATGQADGGGDSTTNNLH